LFSAALATALFASAAHADIYSVATFMGSGIDEPTYTPGSSPPTLDPNPSSTVSAEAVFSYDSTNQQLDVALYNTTTQANLISNNDTLTQIAFDLHSTVFSLNTAVNTGSATGQLAKWVSGGAAGKFQDQGTVTTGNENSEWGIGAITGSGAPSEFKALFPGTNNDNYGISSLTDELVPTPKALNGTNLDNINAYGVIPNVTSPAVSGNFAGFNPYTLGVVNFTVGLKGVGSLSGATVAADLSDELLNVNFLFGDYDPPNAIVPGTPSVGQTPPPAPLPSSAASGFVLLGGIAGFGMLRRKMRASDVI